MKLRDSRMSLEANNSAHAKLLIGSSLGTLKGLPCRLVNSIM